MTIAEHVSLQSLNTLGVQTTARYFTTIQHAADWHELIKQLHAFPSRLILGGGSNVLFSKPFEGIVIKNECKGIQVIKENDAHAWLHVEAGEAWHDVVTYCVAKQYGGIENLALIPGTCGAAPIQNIGAYGVEVKDVIEQVNAIELSSGLEKIFSNEACEFGYRESFFKKHPQQYAVVSLVLKLTKKNHTLHLSYGNIKQTLHAKNIIQPTLHDVYNSVIQIRQAKLPDPKKLANAGSFFKNPIITKAQVDEIKKSFSVETYPLDEAHEKIPAGWLIEQCGWKGKREGNVGTYDKQALILVNYGDARGEEIILFAKKIIESVEKKFNITLTPEVNFY